MCGINQKTDTSHQDIIGGESAPILAETINSKSGNICWASASPEPSSPADVNVIRMTPEITRVTVK